MLASVPDSDTISPVVWMRRAQLTARLGHTADALQDLHRLTAQYPDSPMPAIEEGDIFSGKQHYSEAIAAYSRAIDRMGTPRRADWPVFYQRGIAYDQVHHWPQAEADFREALKLVAWPAFGVELSRLHLGQQG